MSTQGVSRQSITGPQIMEIHEEHAPRFDTPRKQADEAREFLAGRRKGPMPDGMSPEEAEQFRVTLSQQYTAVLKLENKLLFKGLQAKRDPMGVSNRAQAVATKIEQWVNPVMRRYYPDAALNDILLVEGQGGMVTLPLPARWEQLPSFRKDDDPDGPIIERYQRDVRGRARDDEEYRMGGASFEPDEDESLKAWTEEEEWFRARYFPIEFEPVSIRHSTPINPVIQGDRVKLDGLITKEDMSVSELLRRNYIWEKDGKLIEPETYSGGNASLTLYRLIMLDYDGSPYVAYTVDGCRTWKRVKGQEMPGDGAYVVDLSPWCKSLPVAWDYGWNFAGVREPDERGVSFVNVFGRSWMAMSTLMTAMVRHGFKTGFGGWFYEPSPELLQATGYKPGDPLPTPTVKPETLMPVLGTLTPAVHAGSGPDIDKAIAILGQDLAAETPSPGAYGGGGASSAIERDAIEEDTLGVVAQIRQSRQRVFAQSARHALEIGDRIGEQTGKPVIIDATVATPIAQSGQMTSIRQYIELQPGLCGDIYEINAEWEKKRGENLALRQQNLTLYKERVMTLRQFLESDGDPSPEQTAAEIYAEDVIQSDVFRASLAQDAVKILGDERMAEIMEIQAQGQVTQNGIPTAALGMLGGGQLGQQALPPGVAQPNLAASQLGGIVGSQIGAGPAMASAEMAVQNGAV